MTQAPGTMSRRRHELLEEVEATAIEAALEVGVDKAIAEHVGAAIADRLAERWAGQQITFPVNARWRVSKREQAIAARRAEGARIFELAREFEMTERGIRKLLARVDGRSATITPQGDLFPSQKGS